MNQPVVTYTGEGAYHGSTQPKPQLVLNPFGVAETEPTTFLKYAGNRPRTFDTFAAILSKTYEEASQLRIPSEEEIAAERAITFVWKPFMEALQSAGPVTHEVLSAMQPLLQGDKRFCYVDSKIQFFEPGDVAVDSLHYHLDGTIVIRGEFAEQLGYPLLHDMRARPLGPASPPRYLSYQSSVHCATDFVTEPISITVPDFIPDFVAFNQSVLDAKPVVKAQPAASIIRSDGLTLHRAVKATDSGWRLWIRVIETDREVSVTPSVTECYRSVYRP